MTRLTQTLKTRVVGAALLAVGLAVAQAHPGHSFYEADVSHYLTSPYHLMVITLVGLALCSAALLSKRPAVRRTLAACGGMILVTAVVLSQMGS